MNKVEEIIYNFHSKLLTMRRIEYLIESEQFASIYNDSSREEQQYIIKLIDALDIKSLEKAIEIRVDDLGLMNMRELRNIARRLRVKYYLHLPKASLISEIKNARSK